MSSVCQQCGTALRVDDAFCSACGHAIARAPLAVVSAAPGAIDVVDRRRLSGTLEPIPLAQLAFPDPSSAAAAFAGGLPAELAPSGAQPATSSKRRKRRRRRRRWYRRPLVMVPLVLLVLAGTFAGVVAQRLSSTLASVHSVTTPPPQVAVSIDDEDVLAAGGDLTTPRPTIQLDTAPAVAAVAAAGRETSSGGGLFGGVLGAASDLADLGHGAALAAGVGGGSGPALTILVMGVDAGPGEEIDIGVRPDVLIVVRLDPVTNECRLLSVPRDTRTELPGYGETKINHALMVGGIPYQRLVVEQLLGITIDSYALIDFTGFQELVDAVGGIRVTVPEEISENGRVRFPAGAQTFDGANALAYARYRDPATQGDAGRVQRQWALLKGLGRATSGRDLPGQVNNLLSAVGSHFRSDLSASDFAEIARAYGDSCTVDTVKPAMLDGTRIRLNDAIFDQPLYYNVVDEATIEERVATLMGR